jgi:hypothetical protein
MRGACALRELLVLAAPGEVTVPLREIKDRGSWASRALGMESI